MKRTLDETAGDVMRCLRDLSLSQGSGKTTDFNSFGRLVRAKLCCRIKPTSWGPSNLSAGGLLSNFPGGQVIHPHEIPASFLVLFLLLLDFVRLVSIFIVVLSYRYFKNSF